MVDYLPRRSRIYFRNNVPLPIPDTGVGEGGGTCVFLADAWRPIVAGLLDYALDDEYFDDSDDQQQWAQTELRKFIERLTADNEECVDNTLPDLTQVLWCTEFGVNHPINRGTVAASASVFFNVFCRAVPSANGDAFYSTFVARAENMNLEILGIKASDAPKTELYLDNNLVASSLYDWYAAASAYNVVAAFVLTGLAANQQYNLKIVVNGKNTSSSAYVFRFTRVLVY
jgi:hypothetical protein